MRFLDGIADVSRRDVDGSELVLHTGGSGVPGMTGLPHCGPRTSEALDHVQHRVRTTLTTERFPIQHPKARPT